MALGDLGGLEVYLLGTSGVCRKQSSEKNPEEHQGRGWDSFADSVGHLRTQIFLIKMICISALLLE